MTTQEETKVWYAVQVFRKWSSLQVLGIPLDAHAVAPGCVGFMPIFEDWASAKAWRTEHEHPKAGIVAIEAA
jgi:hypothetical protein